MAISVEPLSEYTGARVDGVDISQPIDDSTAQAIHDGMDRYAVLVFKKQPLTAEQQLAFSNALGPQEETHRNTLRKLEDFRHAKEFADVSNLDRDAKPLAIDDRRRLFGIGTRLWHSDSSFKAVPAKYSILHALSVVSKGGNTEFANMAAAWDALDEEDKAEAEGLVCEHSQIYSRMQIGFTDFTDEERERLKPARQALVRTHPSTGRKSLYLASHAGTIVGWPVQEALTYLKDLIEHATQRQFVYSHQWDLGDTVMWDNRQTMHRSRRYPAGEARDMRRTTLRGEGPTAAQA